MVGNSFRGRIRGSVVERSLGGLVGVASGMLRSVAESILPAEEGAVKLLSEVLKALQSRFISFDGFDFRRRLM